MMIEQSPILLRSAYEPCCTFRHNRPWLHTLDGGPLIMNLAFAIDVYRIAKAEVSATDPVAA